MSETTTSDQELRAMLAELASVTECRAADQVPCEGGPKGAVCIGDPYLGFLAADPVRLHVEGKLWLGCE